MAEQQEQEERRQSFVDSFQQDFKMEEGETASGGQGASASASDEQMEEMATDEPENENIEPAELSAVEQIEILKAQISDLEQQVEDLKGTRFGAEPLSKDADTFVSKRFDSFYSWVEPSCKTMIKWSQI